MLSAAAADQPGGDNWGELAEEAALHNQNLNALAPGVGPDREPSPDLVDHLAKVADKLRDLGALVDEVLVLVSRGKGGRLELKNPLTQLSVAIGTAAEAIEDCREGVSYELEQRQADLERRRQFRSNQRRVKDQKTLRDLRRVARESLTDVCKHMDRLIPRLRG